MHNQKKYTLTILGFLTALLSACSQYGDPYKDVPKEVDGHPVYEVPFEQPLVIDPKKEQVFYFKLKKKPKGLGQNYNVYIRAMYPFDDKKYYDISNGIIMNRILINKEMLEFEASITHFNQKNLETKISLNDTQINYFQLPKNEYNHKEVSRFQSKQTQFLAKYLESSPPSRIVDKKEYSVNDYPIIWFLIQEKGGYYRLKIRPLKNFQDYPKLRIAVYIDVEHSPK